MFLSLHNKELQIADLIGWSFFFKIMNIKIMSSYTDKKYTLKFYCSLILR